MPLNQKSDAVACGRGRAGLVFSRCRIVAIRECAIKVTHMSFPEISNSLFVSQQREISGPAGNRPGYPGVFPGLGRSTLTLNPQHALPDYMRHLLAGHGKPALSPAPKNQEGQPWKGRVTLLTGATLPDHMLKVLKSS